MVITPRDIDVLKALARYYTLTRAQIARLCFPHDNSKGRIPRQRLQALLTVGLLNRTRMEAANPAVLGATAPVYYSSHKGLAFLAQELNDDSYKAKCYVRPDWRMLMHYVAVADTHILLDQAALLRTDVTVDEWIGEYDVLDPEAKEPDQRYKLYTLFQKGGLADNGHTERRKVCVPDAGFLLAKEGYYKAFYLEQDRDTTQEALRVAAQKAGGYSELLKVKGHLRHFPKANIDKFMVLVIAPTQRRRDNLLKAFGVKPCAEVYRFTSLSDLTADTFLSKPVWLDCKGSGRTLILPEGGGK